MIKTQTDTYKTAVSHYLSPKRKDSVKVKWERQFSGELTKEVITQLVSGSQIDDISVLDFGCGIGEGWILIQHILQDLDIDSQKIHYLGLDISPEMIKTASQEWQDSPNVEFSLRDFRGKIPQHPVQIYYSCGVPYSHLTKVEMEGVVHNIFQAIKRNQTESLILIDVLGRYSIEWISKWQESRWDYCMSFLAETGDQQEPMAMTCYYAPELEQLFQNAAKATGCDIKSIRFHDRSIMVGRHTTTNEYNSHVPPYREVVNSLYEADTLTDLHQLLLDCPLPDAPEPVHHFFEGFSQQWNALVATAANFRQQPQGFEHIKTDAPAAIAYREALESLSSGRQPDPNLVELTLAEHLRSLEFALQPGLGVGHTLIGALEVKG